MRKSTTAFNNRKRWRLKFLVSLVAACCVLLFVDSAGSMADGQSEPAVPTNIAPFPNEQTDDTTPSFSFQSTDPDEDDIEYQIEWDTDYGFGSPTTKSSSDYPGDAGWTAATFPSGDTVTYTVQSGDELNSDETYWWRVRARDPSGSNLWSGWSTERSLTVNDLVTIPTWFQTTDEQFDTDTKNDVETYGNDQVRLKQESGTTTYDFQGITNPSSTHRATYDGDIDDADPPHTADPWVELGDGEIGTSDYDSIGTEDGSTYEASGSPNDFTPLECRFMVSEDPTTISNIKLTFVGKSQNNDDILQFWVWNYTTSAWNQVGTDFSMTTSIATYSADITSGFSDYIPGGDSLYVLFVHNTKNRDLFVDYVKSDVTYSTQASSGDMTSTVIDYFWLSGEGGWSSVRWNDDETTGDIKYQVYYDVSGTPTIVPDGDLPNNSSGFDDSPIDISGLDTTTYNKLYIKATLTDVGGSPLLQDWTCEAGFTIPTIAGIARATSDGDMTISWGSISGKTYDVYYSDTLQGTYTDVADVVASGDTTSWVDDGSATGSHPDSVVARFYKVECQTGGMSRSTTGKIKRAIASGMQLVSNPLVPFDSSIQSVLGGQLTGAPDEGYADRVWKYDTEVDDYVFAWLVDGVGAPYDGKWWSSQSFEQSSMDLGPDCGFWIQSRNGTQEITFVGQVSDTSDRVISIVDGMQLFGNAYPDTVLLKDSELYEDGATGAPSELNADRVWWWDPDSSYYDYAWLVDSTGSPSDGLWWDSDPWGETSITLRPGQGYWYQARGNPFTWSYLKPYDVPPNPQ